MIPNNTFCNNISKQYKFVPALLKETNKELVNPCRGWYEIYSFNIEEKPDYNELKWCLRKNQSVAFVRINLSSSREALLSEESIENVNEIFGFFANAGKDMIVRFAYDTEGKGLEREPKTLLLILSHIMQLSDVIRKYKKNIFVIQGLFIGSWGEMHTSHYDSPSEIKKIYAALSEAAGDDIFIAVRKPVQLRYIISKEKLKKNLKDKKTLKTGLFNDGIFGSPNHLGTFGIVNRSRSKWDEPWIIEDELDFEESLCEFVPNGGEVVYSNEDISEQYIINVFNKMHISYLNCAHDGRLLDCWKNKTVDKPGIWEGMSLYDYIGRHIGYRIVIRKAEVDINDDSYAEVTVEFENIGFAPLYDKAEFALVLKGENSNSVKMDFPEIIKSASSGKIYSFKLRIPISEGSLYLKMQRKKDGRYIKFAAASIEDKITDSGLLYIGEFTKL